MRGGLSNLPHLIFAFLAVVHRKRSVFEQVRLASLVRYVPDFLFRPLSLYLILGIIIRHNPGVALRVGV